MSEAEKNTDALRRKLGWAADRLDALAGKLTEEAGEMRDKLVDRFGGEEEVKERVDELKEDVGDALDELKDGLGKFVRRFREEAGGDADAGAAGPKPPGADTATAEAAAADPATDAGATGGEAGASDGADADDARGGGGGDAMR